jgi:hypothetical protein
MSKSVLSSGIFDALIPLKGTSISVISMAHLLTKERGSKKPLEIKLFSGNNRGLSVTVKLI